MQPLNPFLAAFFKSPLPSQCTPVQQHVLLVPTTDVLLTSREAEAAPASASGNGVAETVSTEEFLSSHVLRVSDPTKPATNGGSGAAGGSGGKDATPNLREMRGKAKQYNTINGRNVVIKDNVVYTNKGARFLRDPPRELPRWFTVLTDMGNRLQDSGFCQPPRRWDIILRHT